jgi:hypothetical protein
MRSPSGLLMVMSLQGINRSLDELLRVIVFVGGTDALTNLDPQTARHPNSHLDLFMAEAEGFMRVLSLTSDDAHKRFAGLDRPSSPNWRLIFDISEMV